MNSGMYKNQFLLTTKTTFRYQWQKIMISEYCLYVHPDLEIAHSREENRATFLIGLAYDWKNPSYSNQKICDRILQDSNNIEELIENTSAYSGGYLIIAEFGKELFIVPDACAQREVYFDTEYQGFASQVKLLEEVVYSIDHQNSQARSFYQSSDFNRKRLFAGNSTHKANILHLAPNHYIDIRAKRVTRFFPAKVLEKKSVAEVSEKVIRILQGYMKAIASRSPMAIAVTAGYDSRVLFLASLNEQCRYFIDRHDYMKDDHYELVIANKLVTLFNREFLMIPDEFYNDHTLMSNYKNSIDFPRREKQHVINFPDHIFINGNISEIGRNYYGYHKKLNGKELCLLYGYGRYLYPAFLYDNWLKENYQKFTDLGYNYLDMFYWEERMSRWAVKSKTESLSIGKKVISPFNSRELINLILSVERRYRDSHHNVLYDNIIRKMSPGKPEAWKLPINPTPKRFLIRLMKLFRIYNTYQSACIKYESMGRWK